MSIERELEGRTAIVTGASRGIGRATARRLAAAGASVLLTARGAEAGEVVATELRAEGGQAIFVQADQSQGEDWARVMDVALRTFDGLDILVVNAGVTGAVRTVDLSLADFRALNQINLKGPFLGIKHASAVMRERGGGSIALVASIVGKIAVPDHIHYTAAKGGVRLLAKAAALELGPDKIRVNSLHPGMTRTDMIAGYPDAVIRAAPLERAAEPEDIAEAALFLASDRSIFMTGAEIVVDGGWIVR